MGGHRTCPVDGSGQGWFLSLWVAPFSLERGGDGDTSLAGHRYGDQSPGSDSMYLLPTLRDPQVAAKTSPPPPKSATGPPAMWGRPKGRLSSRNTLSSSWKTLFISSGFPLEDALLFSVSVSFSLPCPVPLSPPLSSLSILPDQPPHFLSISYHLFQERDLEVGPQYGYSHSLFPFTMPPQATAGRKHGSGPPGP